MSRIKSWTVFIRSDDFMNDDYIFGNWKDYQEMERWLKENKKDWHVVWARID